MNDLKVEEVIKGMRDLGPMIDPEDDYLAIAAAEEQMNATLDKRRKDLEDVHSSLRTLAKILDAARASSTRPLSVPSEEQHSKILNDLDSSRVSLAKAIADAESTLTSKENELSRLKEEARVLEKSDPASEHDLDGTALRLQIYKGLGFEPVSDKDGRVRKMLMRSSSGEVHCVDFDRDSPSRLTPDVLWQMACS